MEHLKSYIASASCTHRQKAIRCLTNWTERSAEPEALPAAITRVATAASYSASARRKRSADTEVLYLRSERK